MCSDCLLSSLCVELLRMSCVLTAVCLLFVNPHRQVGTAGGTYEGDWIDGEWEGYGAFTAANGDVYGRLCVCVPTAGVL